MCAVRARGLAPHPQRHADPVQWHHLSSPTGAGANDNLSRSSTLTDLIAAAIGITLLGVPLLLAAMASAECLQGAAKASSRTSASAPT